MMQKLMHRGEAPRILAPSRPTVLGPSGVEVTLIRSLSTAEMVRNGEIHELRRGAWVLNASSEAAVRKAEEKRARKAARYEREGLRRAG